MNKLRGLSLNIIIPIIVSIIFILFQSVVLYFEYIQSQKTLYTQSEQHVKGIAGQLQTSLSNALMRLEKSQAQADISTAALDENIKTIAIIDENQQIVLSNNFRERFMFAKLQLAQYDGQYLSQVINGNKMLVMYQQNIQELVVYAPLQMISKGNSLNRKYNGVIFIRYSLANAYRVLSQETQMRLVKSSIILLISILLLAFINYKLIISPLNKVVGSLKESDTNGKVSLNGLGEVGKLQCHLNEIFDAMNINMDKLAADEERWVYAINGSQNGVWDWDITNDKIFYSNRWKEILGFDQDYQFDNDVMEWESRIHPDDVYELHQELAAHFNGRKPYFESVQRILAFNGEYKWILSRGQAISWDKNGNPLRMVGTIIDLTSYKNMNHKIQYLDTLHKITNLPNRQQLISRIKKERARIHNAEMYGSVIFMSSCQFHIVNELEGHSEGDKLLAAIAERLTKHKSIADFIAHIQGCEFAIVLPDLSINKSYAKHATKQYIDELQKLLTQPFKIQNNETILPFCFGVTLFHLEDTTPEDILRQSAIAMKTAQESQVNCVTFFTTTLEEKIHKEHFLQNDIRKALENREFKLFFQARVDSDGKLVAAEALSRWYRGDLGWSNPSDFIPVAESTDLIIPLGNWVIREAFDELARWVNQGLPYSFKHLSINISPKQLMDINFIPNIKQQLSETGIDAKLIELEITESVVLKDIELSINKLVILRGMGFSIAIDDFGTGYSSFSYLSKLPVNVLKIDQFFIKDVLEEKNQKIIVTSIIDMAHSLELTVVAEGIETEQQFKFLTEKGCQQFQGFYIGEPITAESFRTSQFLTQSNRY
ncbi:putative bifunctional diguanylate cyclase/phosphodiesterase [Psychromonas aquatilis]|uniref:EAL domain-containing protein n=1 Tax=Psychromonas aquatilis TaxID=2005072 RepID=A0ABU9GR76_9GAMM